MPTKLTQAEFLMKAAAIHGSKYDYSQAVYELASVAMTIICPRHGPFKQTSSRHLSGAGCRICAKKQPITLAVFLARAIEKHGNKYDYSLTSISRAKDKVQIICPEHGIFSQAADSHTYGAGCPKCGYANMSKLLRKGAEEFIAQARQAHGNAYDYSQVIYNSLHDKITIICPEHGPFEQWPQGHLKGNKCPICSKREWGLRIRLSTEEFIARAVEVHGEKYEYSQAEYVMTKNKVKIICPEHGVFEQLPHTHLSGAGCIICGNLSRQRGTTEEFIARAVEVHGDRYDYSKARYTVSRQKLKIICLTHGAFEQDPRQHLLGSGCPACGRQRSTAASRLDWIAKANGRTPTLYFVRLRSDCESFYKVGVTYKSIGARFYKSVIPGYCYEVLAEWQSINAGAVYDWEQSILETFAHLKYVPKIGFIGQTECFSSCEEILAIFPIAG